MTAIAKHPISFGTGTNKVIVPKGTKGHIKAVSNSPAIREQFPNLEHKVDGWFYIVQFPNMEDTLVSKEQIEIQ